MNILIRADSSSQIGLGHIMRSLVLATHYPDDTVIFACQDLIGNIMNTIPYTTEILHSNDVQELIALIRSKQIEMVIFDHYDIDVIFENPSKSKPVLL